MDGDPVVTCRFWAGSTRAASTAARDAATTTVLARLVAEDVLAPTPVHRVIIATDEAAERAAGRTAGAEAAP